MPGRKYLPAVYLSAVLWSSMNRALASTLLAFAMLPNAFVKAGDLFADHAVKEVDDGAAVEFGAGLVQESGSAVAPFDVPAVEGGLVILEEILFGDGLVRIVQNIFLFFQKS